MGKSVRSSPEDTTVAGLRSAARRHREHKNKPGRGKAVGSRTEDTTTTSPFGTTTARGAGSPGRGRVRLTGIGGGRAPWGGGAHAGTRPVEQYDPPRGEQDQGREWPPFEQGRGYHHPGGARPGGPVEWGWAEGERIARQEHEEREGPFLDHYLPGEVLGPVAVFRGGPSRTRGLRTILPPPGIERTRWLRGHLRWLPAGAGRTPAPPRPVAWRRAAEGRPRTDSRPTLFGRAQCLEQRARGGRSRSCVGTDAGIRVG